MKKKIGYSVVILSVVAILAELLGLSLPTLRGAFNVSKEVSYLPESFGYGFYVLLIIIGVYLILSDKKVAISPVTQRRIQRFKQIRRGYFSFIVILFLGLLASLDQVLVGNKALVVKYDGNWTFPAFVKENYDGKKYGREGEGASSPAEYRTLKKQLQREDSGWVIMPLVPFKPTQDKVDIPVRKLKIGSDGKLYKRGSDELYNGLATTLYDSEDASSIHLRHKYRKGVYEGVAEGKTPGGKSVYRASYKQGKVIEESIVWSGDGALNEFLSAVEEPPHEILYFPAPPNKVNWLGTDSTGNDLVAYLFGGLQINFRAVLIYIPIVYVIGVTVGLAMGYFGGVFDLLVQRLIEVLSNIPLLFVLVIVSSGLDENMRGLGAILFILIAFGWMGMTYLMRTSAYKERERDYVSASRVLGASSWRILFRHILPNTVAILVTLIPFSVSGVIMSLTSLDYLGFGLPVKYASWGTLLKDGLDNLSSPWLVTSSFFCLVILLVLVTFVGEAVREAFDPKQRTFYR